MSNNQTNDESRELIFYFVLTFSISWTIWFLAPLISLGDSLLLIWICLIGAFGPSISAYVISSRVDSNHEDNSKKKKVAFVHYHLDCKHPFRICYIYWCTTNFLFCYHHHDLCIRHCIILDLWNLLFESWNFKFTPSVKYTTLSQPFTTLASAVIAVLKFNAGIL